MVRGKGKVDKWKTKSWYNVLAPELFERKEIAQIVATEDNDLVDRVVEVGMDELTGDHTHGYANLKFRVNEVKGRNALTTFIGHELSRNYLKTMVRRRKSVIREVVDAVTKDGKGMRIKVVVFTGVRIKANAKTGIRLAVEEIVKNHCKGITLAQLEQEVLFKKFSSFIYKQIKKIAPVRRVEIRKTELKEKTVS